MKTTTVLIALCFALVAGCEEDNNAQWQDTCLDGWLAYADWVRCNGGQIYARDARLALSECGDKPTSCAPQDVDDDGQACLDALAAREDCALDADGGLDCSHEDCTVNSKDIEAELAGKVAGLDECSWLWECVFDPN